jgi:hypothetical protein
MAGALGGPRQTTGSLAGTKRDPGTWRDLSGGAGRDPLLE